jgi:hypothetical protein
VLGGAGAVAIVAALVLLALGWLDAFVHAMRVYAPTYAAMDRQSPFELLKRASTFSLHLGGFALAAVVTLPGRQSPRARIAMALTAFGLLHFFLQRKAYFYQAYPLLAGLVCWGALSLRQVPLRVGVLALALVATLFGLRLKVTPSHVPVLDVSTASATTAAMQRALASQLPRGARVQMLDTGDTAFLAMARAGMRQATPYTYWFFLRPAYATWRRDLIVRLQDRPPEAVLLANSGWVKGKSGLSAEWPELHALLSCCYVLVEDHMKATPSYVSPSWRLYVRRNRT